MPATVRPPRRRGTRGAPMPATASPRADLGEDPQLCRLVRPPAVYNCFSSRGAGGWGGHRRAGSRKSRWSIEGNQKAADCSHGRPTSSSWLPAAIMEGEDAQRRRGHWLGARTLRRSASRREGSKAEAEDGLGGDPRRRGMTRVVDRRPGAESRLGGRAQRDDEGAGSAAGRSASARREGSVADPPGRGIESEGGGPARRRHHGCHRLRGSRPAAGLPPRGRRRAREEGRRHRALRWGA